MRQAIEKIPLAEKNFVVHGIQMLRDDSSVRQFAVCVLGVAHRERFYRGVTDLRHQGGHSAGIHASAEKNAERHVTHQVTAHSLLQHLPVGLDVVTLRM